MVQAKKKSFDKYWYYRNSVQSPENDVQFFQRVYKELRGQNSEAQTFREDFCGTFALSCEWAKLAPNYVAYGVDLDAEPIAYGKAHYLTELNSEQQSRVHILNKNVLDKRLPKTDLIAALNFSYFIFKTRKEIKNYFANALKHLNKKGVFLIDCFGGKQCYLPNEEITEHPTFNYHWDQESYNPITSEALFHIHFKPKGQKLMRNVFTYDWRLWSIAELRELLLEAGFKHTFVYWEGTSKNGQGNGEFTQTEQGDDCEAWIAYIAATPD